MRSVDNPNGDLARSGEVKMQTCTEPGCITKMSGVFDMKLTNDSYVVLIGTKNFIERYFRDQTGWLKVSARGRKFRMTSEQVLNHVLPAIAGINPNLIIKVEHHDPLSQKMKSKTTDEHLATLDGDKQAALKKIRKNISAAVWCT